MYMTCVRVHVVEFIGIGNGKRHVVATFCTISGAMATSHEGPSGWPTRTNSIYMIDSMTRAQFAVYLHFTAHACAPFAIWYIYIVISWN